MSIFRFETPYIVSYILFGQFVLDKTTILYVGPIKKNTRMNLFTFLSGVLVRNGGSFEDDLSLGAEGKFVWKNCIFIQV